MTATALHYRVEAADVYAHLFRVTLTIDRPALLQELSLPVWIPGSYLVREFAQNLQNLRAHQGQRKVALVQLDKHRWQAPCDLCHDGVPLVLEYEIYANDASVRTASLDAARGFFNGTSLFLQVHGQADRPCVLEIIAPKLIATQASWACVTGLFPLKIEGNGFGSYRAADYDELVDCPVEMGTFWSASFTAAGAVHRLVVTGAAPSLDGPRLLADTRKICETTINFWHGKGQAKGKLPFQNYLFLLHATADGYGGLEHRNSTALICARADLPRIGAAPTGEGYTTLLGLIGHEYFHTWNIKRLRPAEFTRCDYTRENYTDLLWFFEGFTSYYDDLLLRRAGLIDDAAYLKLIGKTIQQVEQTPGRSVQTVAQASFDTWVKFYRADENTPNATISYYTKGALVALCLDLTLRHEGQTTLDEVMRGLWQRCAGGPMTESDLRAVLQALAGRSLAAELDAWVHSTAELPVAKLLAAHGVALEHEAATPAQRFGLRATENGSVRIKGVLRGGLAERAGMEANDEWLGIEVQGQGWRIGKLADIALYAGPEKQIMALVGRGDRLLRLPFDLALPTTKLQKNSGALLTAGAVSLHIQTAVLASAWLAGP